MIEKIMWLNTSNMYRVDLLAKFHVINFSLDQVVAYFMQNNYFEWRNLLSNYKNHYIVQVENKDFIVVSENDTCSSRSEARSVEPRDL